MGKRILLIVCFIILASYTAVAYGALIEAEGRYWITDLTANAKVVESSIGTDLDFKSDLDVKDENFPEARVILHTGENSKFRLAYTQVNYSGENTVTRTVEFAGKSYTAGTLVNSSLDIQYARFGWIWQFVNLFGKLKAGPMIELKAISADISLEAPNLSPKITESESFIGGLPTPGFALDVNPLEAINLFAEISGLPAGDLGYFFDAEAGVKLTAISNFSLTAGYRIIDIKAESDPDFVKIKMTGPFVCGVLRF